MVILNIPDNFEQFVCFANIICSEFCLDIFDVDRDHMMGKNCACAHHWAERAADS